VSEIRIAKPFTPLRVSAPVRTCPQTRPDQTFLREGLNNGSDSPSLSFFTRQLFQLLDSGVASVSDTRNGLPWPRPRIEGIRRLVEQYGADVALSAAKEAREIVQSQDRAPNVTGLFAKKCADIAAERMAVRDQARQSVEGARRREEIEA
jgi:hypothetical protein